MTAIAGKTAVGIIPARYASKRFPGKVLALIAGRPMIQHVWESASTAKHLREVIVATDDEKVARICEGFGARVVVTSAEHPTGTDRIAEAARGLTDDVVVNIQGDEPLIEGFVIDAAIEALVAEANVPVATVVHAAGPEAGDDRNRVKVVLDRNGFALAFSRGPISAPPPEPADPADRAAADPKGNSSGDDSPGSHPYLQHVGLYAYRSEFLQEFVRLPHTPGELAEGLEQLRVLENGYRIRAATIEGWTSVPVDVPSDIPRVESLLASRSV